MKKKNDGKWFEKVTFEQVSKINNNHKILLKPSEKVQTTFGTWRQVDARSIDDLGLSYVVYECKDESSPIGIKASEQAEGIMKDIGAKKAAVVGNNRFTADLIKRCKAHNIELLQIIDTKEKRLRTTVKFKTLTTFYWISQYKYRGVFCDGEFEINILPTDIKDTNSNKTIHEMVTELWNSRTLSSQPGINEYKIDKFFLLTAEEHGLKTKPVDGLIIEYVVQEKSYALDVPIADGSGVLDVVNQRFYSTSEVTGVGPFSVEDIVKLENAVNDSEIAKFINNVSFKGEAYFVME